jgi:hypothetical protein
MSERIQNPNLKQKKKLLVSIPGIGKATHDEWYEEFMHLEFIVTSSFSKRGRRMVQ